MNSDPEPLLRVENLVKHYERKHLAAAPSRFTALNGVSFALFPKDTLALVGESGSGKSTLAMCIACLDRPTSGDIWFEGQNLATQNEPARREVRPKIQLVLQDPARSLNARWTALEVVCEPLIIQRRLNRRQQAERSLALLDLVGLARKWAERRVDEFSGGQRQRLAIARALALNPKLIILDEALSALDCSVQAQISNLLLDLQSSLGLSYLFITHDFVMAAHLAGQITVMDHGQIVESGPAEKVFRSPAHRITQALLAATPHFAAPAQQVPR